MSPPLSPSAGKRFLPVLVFGAGAGTLGIELSAARLLEPWFGNSQIVWAALIALVLACLALGAWLGGKLGDRSPRLDQLLLGVAAAGLATGLIPLAAPAVLRIAVQDLLHFEASLLVAAILVVGVLLGVPVILLGAVTPWALRIALTSVQSGGHTAGRLYAAATLGSIAGTLLPVLWLIPALGTRWTFHLMATFLMLLAASGAPWLSRHRWSLALLGLGGTLLLLGLGFLTDTQAVRQVGSQTDAGELIYEDESRFNYIAVRRKGTELYLKLNEGVGIHSVHHPDTLLSLGIWDYFLLAPWFSAEPPDPAAAEVLIIGLAAGTVSALWTAIYGPAPITGIELDPQIIEVGQTYFGMNQPNLTAIAADGRQWLQAQPASRQWDVIAIDAYRVPYIPFHLATVEFFALVQAHLTPAGAVAINVGRTREDQVLVDHLVATMAQVFPTVMAVHEPVPAEALGNTLVVGLAQATELEQYHTHIANLSTDYPAAFRTFAQTSLVHATYAHARAGAVPLTDDRAPIERIVHGMVWDFLRAVMTDT